MQLTIEQRDALQLLAWLHLRCGRPEGAQTLLKVLLRADPDHLAGRRASVVAALELGDWARAEQQCLALRDAGEQRAPLWLCLSQAQQMAGRLEVAQATFGEYLQRKARP
ncbi:type III secretion apparatus assembly chaperone SctY [Pseudomonas mosselii]|uniref:type III secretion apparatus assembly chaperone SctY n=1 Tax=Pseudomonas mosselii TaxID=78327 RepID=UPI000D808BE6|nr:type III secretion protein [Pseudomonas mosselii]PYC28653.1 type III secretion protein [Pseudomonas mosselii]